MIALDNIVVCPEVSIADAMDRLDQAGAGAVALCTGERKLYGLLTDGDIRRAVLRGMSTATPCGEIANRNPIVACSGLSAREALYVMSRRDINHLPVVNDEGRLEDFLLRRDLVPEDDLRESARKRLSSVVISPSASITDAVAHLDKAGTGALALCTDGRRLHGILTDGDVRRAVLRGVPLEDACETIASCSPVVAQGSISSRQALRLMVQHDVSHLPIVDSEGNLAEFLLRRDLTEEGQPSLSAVIMAGGLGKRLLPLTEQVPKPMLPVGDRPLLERTIQQLRRSGIRDVSLTTHYLPESIAEHFGDGEAFGVKLRYSNEEQPLGTAGGLKLLDLGSEPFLVINGDILTGVSFEEMLRYHRRYQAELTVGVCKHDVQVPFGVIECDDVRVRALREKPSLTLFINAGVYLLEPSVRDCIPDGEHFDMTDLIKRLLEEGRTVVSFPIIEYWQDVGRHEDYQRAQEDVREGRI